MMKRALDENDPRLFQEQLLECYDGRMLTWAMASCCTIIQRSNRAAAFPVMRDFFGCFIPQTAADEGNYERLAALLRPSGLHYTKAIRIANMSSDVVAGLPYTALTGTGPYFRQSYEIFALKRVPPVHLLKDTHLRAYVEKKLAYAPT